MDEQIKRQTLLIVDDEPVNIKIFLEMLRSDYTIKVATDGEKALQIAQSDNPPDLIILDVMMPGIDGYEVCRRLKAEPRTKDIPIIFVTAKGGEDDQTKGFELGAVDYIAKPFSPIVVMARIKTHLELKRNRDFLEWMLKERTREMQEMEKEYMYMFLRK